MPESRREWPPRKLTGELDDIWLSRLHEEIALEYQDWLAKLALGDTDTLIEAAEDAMHSDYMYSETFDTEPSGLDQISDEEVNGIVLRAIANSDQLMAAVRNGDPNAVNEYAENELAVMKFLIE